MSEIDEMAIESDDCDIRRAWFNVELGGNSDYYLTTVEVQDVFDHMGALHSANVLTSVRISTSGGKAPTDVKLAVAELYRALEKHGLNMHPMHQIYEDEQTTP